MGERIIINKESVSAGKKVGNNDDDIYIGKDFAAVIDGVSHKSTILTEGKDIKIAGIIIEALKKMDRPNAPVYAKTLTFEECTRFINLYIEKYLKEHNLGDRTGDLEATGVIYSRYHNQIWLVGDCKAIYDGIVVENPLKIDDVTIDIRVELVKALLEEGYTEENLLENDVSKEIIKNPKLLSNYIKEPKRAKQLEEYRTQRIKKALIECGFSEEKIEKDNLVQKYYNPRDLQAQMKNNPEMGAYGYSVFNGKYTETKNCRVVTLPRDVKSIKMFSDGFSTESLNNDSDIGYAIRRIRKEAKKDPLSINTNKATHTTKRYSDKSKSRTIDDASAVIIEIKEVENEIGERG